MLPSLARAELNTDESNLTLRASLGGGRILWAYVNYGSSSGDLGQGPGAVFSASAMYSYRFIGAEGSLLVGTISSLEWTDEDDFGVSHTWKSDGTGHFTMLDLKLGARLFAGQGDMGYTYFYAGVRMWSTSRDENSLTYDGITQNYQNEYEANGDGWIIGFRDFSTIGMDSGFAFAFQTGLHFGKAPVDSVKRNGTEQVREINDTLLIGGELAAGIALQNIGFSVIGGFRGEVMLSTFVDPAAPIDEESVFGFGNIIFFVEASMQF
jgi:hypothetical protein